MNIIIIILKESLMKMVEYKSRGISPTHYESDYHFYRDLDPQIYLGDDSLDKSLINNKGNSPSR